MEPEETRTEHAFDALILVEINKVKSSNRNTHDTFFFVLLRRTHNHEVETLILRLVTRDVTAAA